MKNEYSLAAALRAAVSGSWNTSRSGERDWHEKITARASLPLYPSDRWTQIRVPAHGIRDLSVSPASAGGYLTDAPIGEYIAALAGDSAALRLGVTSFPVERGAGSLAFPRATTGAAAYWLAAESTQIPEGDLTLASVAATPKTLAARMEFSRSLLVNAANLENILRGEIRRALAAAADAAIFAGTGMDGQPSGIVGMNGVGTFTGTSLDQAALRNAQADLGAAKAILDPSKVAYVAAPAVAETLATRPRVASTDSRMLWEGSSFEGTVEGVRAISTAAMPAGTVILGDWSAVQIAEWPGGLVLAVDPGADWATGKIAVRAMLMCDVLVSRPAAFSVAESVT